MDYSFDGGALGASELVEAVEDVAGGEAVVTAGQGLAPHG